MNRTCKGSALVVVVATLGATLSSLAPSAAAEPAKRRASALSLTQQRLARALPRGVRFESSANYGLVAIVTAQDLRPNRGRIFRAFVSDGTRRGTRPLGDFSAAQTSAGLGGPVGGRAWSIFVHPTEPSTHDFILSFLDPATGITPAGQRHGFAPLDRTATDATLWIAGAYVNENPARHVIAANPGGDTDLGAHAPGPLFAAGTGVVFTLDGGDGAGVEPWAIASPGAGAARLGDLRPGSASSAPALLGTAGGRVVLVADDGSNGRELWTADPAGTIVPVLPEIRPGAASPGTFLLGTHVGVVLVSADDGVHGREPWIVDPVAATATQVDLVPGGAGSEPADAVWTRGGLWIVGRDDLGDPAVWLVTGTTAEKISAIRGNGPIEDLGIGATAGGRVDVYATRDGEAFHWIARRGDDRPPTTYFDGDSDGFSDDAERAVGTNSADAASTPYGNARAVPGGVVGEVVVRTRRGRCDVQVVVTLPEGRDAMDACSLIVNAGGAVGAAAFSEGQRTAVRAGARIARSRLADGRLAIRARIATDVAPREDGAGGSVPVIVHIDAVRAE